MKRKLLFAMAAMLSAIGVQAQSWTAGVTADAGEYYLYNIGADMYLNRGSEWGTHATVDGAGIPCTLSKNGDAYNITTSLGKVFIDGKNEPYLDGSNAENFTLESVSVDGYTNAYTLKNSGGEYAYWIWAQKAGQMGAKVNLSKEIISGSENNFYWLLIPKTDREDYSQASDENPVDVTYLVPDPDMERDSNDHSKGSNVWTGGLVKQYNGENHPYYTGHYLEQYVNSGQHLGNYDEYLTLTSIPNGIYKFTAYAAGVQQSGNEAVTGVSLYAGEKETAVTDFALYTIDDIEVTDHTLKIGFKTVNTTANWVSFDRVRLYYKGYVPADFSKLEEALEAAKADAANITLGFDEGEYAPYTNIEILSAIASAENIDKTASQEEVDALTETLINARWEENREDVDAVYNGNFAIGQGSPAADIQKYGWTRTNGWGQFRDDTAGGRTSYYNQPGSLQYGNAGLYTMPLKGNTIYTLTFSYASWEYGSNNSVTVSVKCDDDGTSAPVVFGKYEPTHTESVTTKTLVFATGKAGNYVLTLANSGNTVMTDVSIKKAEEQVLFFENDAVPSYAPGTYPTVIIERGLSADTWATAVYPFAISADDVTVATLTSFSEEGVLSFSTEGTSVANEPCLIKADGAIELTNVEVKAAVATDKVDNGITFKGVYATETVGKAEEGINYVLSDNVLYPVGDNEATVKPFRAYFQLAEDANVPEDAKSRIAISVDGGEATGIDAVEIAADKIVSGEIYNLAGQRVAQPTNGIYIVNGKKVLIKK